MVYLIHLLLVVLQHAEAIGKRIVDKVIELPHLNPHERLLLLLLFSGRGLYLLFWRRYLAILYPKIDAVRLLGQFSRLYHVIQQTNVGAPRHVFAFLSEGRIVH